VDPSDTFTNITRTFLAIPIKSSCCQGNGLCGEQFDLDVNIDVRNSQHTQSSSSSASSSSSSPPPQEEAADDGLCTHTPEMMSSCHDDDDDDDDDDDKDTEASALFPP
jgi:hypothetical protein